MEPSKERIKFDEIHKFINENIYFGVQDIQIGPVYYNSALLLGMLTCINNGKIMYVGDYGLGKTTLAETISSAMLSTPKGIISAGSIKGHPEIDYEQIIGRIHKGELNKGIEKVIWSQFIKAPSKIIDEINRIPEQKQNMLLGGMQNNTWTYLNNVIYTEETPWFATKNESDNGNATIIPPLLDRFDLCIETKAPSINNIRNIRYANQNLLTDKELEKKYMDLNFDEEQRLKETLNEMKNIFSEKIKKEHGLELFVEQELINANKQIKKIPFSFEANMLLDFYFADSSTCQEYGQKRKQQTCPETCENLELTCSKTKNNLSVRTINAIETYAKSMAWLSLSEQVNLEHINIIIPYATWHKNEFEKNFLEETKKEKTHNPLKFYASTKIIEQTQKRFIENVETQKQFINLLLNEQQEQAIKLAEQQKHPVFKEYLK